MSGGNDLLIWAKHPTSAALKGDIALRAAEVRVEYDTLNYLSTTVGSSGIATLTADELNLVPGSGGVRIASGARIAKVLYAVASLTVNLTTDDTYVRYVTVTGALPGDLVIVSPTTAPTYHLSSWSGLVSSADTVQVNISTHNFLGGPADTRDYAIAVIRLS